MKQGKTRKISRKETLEAESNAQRVCRKRHSLDWSVSDRAVRPSHRLGVRAEGMGAAMSVGKVAAVVEVRVTHHRTREEGETSRCMASGNEGTKV